ncbi:MAG TPA: DUF4382 domain-containing protein [Flavobacteriaceae bacterium]|nr:DUF4382 domain-containing protein [Flavobacteriaceae bacterium]
MKLNKFNLIIALVSLMTFSACSNDDDSGNVEDTNARMTVKLVDAPGDYDEVNIDVQDVLIKYQGNEGEVSLDDVNVGVYNLLELTGGNFVLLSDDDDVPEGTINQIRLVLGTENTIVVDGESYPLQTPSAQQSGLKIQIDQPIIAGNTYNLTLDFDVGESIVQQGNGGYLLKPVIRGSLDAETGTITGIVLPIETQVLVTANNGENEISTYTNAEGIYFLNGVPEGTYTLTFEVDPALETAPIILSNIEVVAGEVTNVEAVTFL